MSDLTHDDDELLRRYLLGALTEEEQERAEDRLLRDASVLDLDDAEDNLVEEFLRGSLSPAERAQFEGHFLAYAPHRLRLAASRALREHVFARLDAETAAPLLAETMPSPVATRRQRPLWRPRLMAAAAVVCVALAGLWWSERRGEGPGLSREAQSGPPATAVPGRAGGATPGEDPDAGTEVFLRLLPGQAMAAAAPRARAVIAPSTTHVRLELVLEHDRFDSYQVALSVGGEEIWKQEESKPLRTVGGSSLVLSVPVVRIGPAGDVRVRLGGRRGNGELQPVASYSFRVLPSR